MIAIILVVAVVFWVISTYNSLISLRMKVKEGLSTIDVFLKKRYDLIPNLVETVKGYAKHEKETLNQVVDARSKALSSGSEDKAKYEGELSSVLSKLLMISENYPDLKADTQFVNLQNQLQQIESEIEKSRRYYNGVVRAFNTNIQRVPTCIIANLFNFKEEPFFELEDYIQRENIEVKF
ncbi:MAG: LemA family protein [Peptostreptococcaceae bacterium]